MVNSISAGLFVIAAILLIPAIMTQRERMWIARRKSG
jgi:hypothetical protein